MTTDNSKAMLMSWAPTSSLSQPKRIQFRFTDNAGDQGFFLYYSDNGVDLRRLLEHAFFYPQVVATTTLTPLEKVLEVQLVFHKEQVCTCEELEV